MTQNEVSEDVGVRAHSAGKRRFWTVTFVQIAAVAAIVAAMLLMQGGTGPRTLPQGGAIAVAIAFVLVINVGGWWTFRVSDELEVRTNLIAFTAGSYVHLTLFSVWTFLRAGGVMGEPDAAVIIMASGIASLATYVFLKLRH